MVWIEFSFSPQICFLSHFSPSNQASSDVNSVIIDSRKSDKEASKRVLKVETETSEEISGTAALKTKLKSSTIFSESEEVS